MSCKASLLEALFFCMLLACKCDNPKGYLVPARVKDQERGRRMREDDRKINLDSVKRRVLSWKKFPGSYKRLDSWGIES